MITFRIAKTPQVADRASQHSRAGLLAGALLFACTPLFGATPPAQTCEQIRVEIGVAPLADADLLRKLALRKDCGFTSREIYLAAYGDRPLPPQEGREKYLKRYHHIDDHIDDD
jgi:hypothetical protein